MSVSSSSDRRTGLYINRKINTSSVLGRQALLSSDVGWFSLQIYYPDVGACLICALLGSAPFFKKSSLIKTILYLCSQ